MAGIYIHIPFCKQACHYCDFHFSTNLTLKAILVEALLKEMELRSNELEGEIIETIYLGGGTPSLLKADELEKIIRQCYTLFKVADKAEITLEANPDDVERNHFRMFRELGVNRISLGIQTFDDKRLKLINRAHTSNEARDALQTIQDVGFTNITADLIYAIPPDDIGYWKKDLETLSTYNLPHISIYGLTIEEKTVFGNWTKKGKLKEVKEEVSIQQYEYAVAFLESEGYVHYEASNFAKPGYESRHNSAYWNDQLYLGIGPGAHSYKGKERSFNVRSNPKYIKSIDQGSLPLEVEKLSDLDKWNEYLFTHLRTKRGIDLDHCRIAFSRDLLVDHQETISDFIKNGLLIQDGNSLVPTSKGLMLADEMSLRLFYDE